MRNPNAVSLPMLPSMRNDGSSCVACGGRLGQIVVVANPELSDDAELAAMCTRCNGFHAAMNITRYAAWSKVRMAGRLSNGTPAQYFNIAYVDALGQTFHSHGWLDDRGRVCQFG